MKIAIASGKGGTGKTTIAVNLAMVIANTNVPVEYLDCDVEEPNGAIFLQPKVEKKEDVTAQVPQVDPEKCTGCNRCGLMCQYSAIIALKTTAITFDSLCHSCKGCMLVCPEKAITMKQIVIGEMEKGQAKNVAFVQGKLKIGSVRTPSLIKKVKQQINDDKVSIIDAPPGTTCPVIEAVKGVDFLLLVTEPTPFGVNDLKLAVEMAIQLKLPFAVVVNRKGAGDDEVYRYCREKNIDIIMELPDDKEIAVAYSTGKMIVEALPKYKKNFIELYEAIVKKIAKN